MIHYWSIQSWTTYTAEAVHYYLHVEDEHTNWILHEGHLSRGDAMRAAIELGRKYRRETPEIRLLHKEAKYR